MSKTAAVVQIPPEIESAAEAALAEFRTLLANKALGSIVRNQAAWAQQLIAPPRLPLTQSTTFGRLAITPRTDGSYDVRQSDPQKFWRTQTTVEGDSDVLQLLATEEAWLSEQLDGDLPLGELSIGERQGALQLTRRIPVDLTGWVHAYDFEVEDEDFDLVLSNDDADLTAPSGIHAAVVHAHLDERGDGLRHKVVVNYIGQQGRTAAEETIDLKHELTHLVQILMAPDAESFGLMPDQGGRLSGEQAADELSTLPHAQRSIEFYPRVREEVERFLAEHPSYSQDDLREWVDSRETFTALEGDRWQKAVTSFYKAVTERRRTAQRFTPPPRMVESVMEAVQEALLRWGAREFREMRQSARPLRRSQDVVRAQVPIDLSDWDLAAAATRAIVWKKINLEIHLGRGGGNLGEWSDLRRTLSIFLEEPPRTVAEATSVLSTVRATVEHELTHFAQFVLGYMVGNAPGSAGLPTGQAYSSWEDLRRPYTQQLREFYPLLRDSVTRFIQFYEPDELQDFVASDALFVRMREEAPELYQKALKEFYKAVTERRTATVNVVDEAPESHDDAFWDTKQPGQLDSQDTAFPTVTDNDSPAGADRWAPYRKREGSWLPPPPDMVFEVYRALREKHRRRELGGDDAVGETFNVAYNPNNWRLANQIERPFGVRVQVADTYATPYYAPERRTIVLPVDASRSTIAHELTHYAQHLLAGAGGSSRERGQPRRKDRGGNPYYDKNPTERSAPEHSVSDVEFWPKLSAFIDHYRLRLEDPAQLSALVGATSGPRPPNAFFSHLKRYAPRKWQTAVKYAYDAIFGKNEPQRVTGLKQPHKDEGESVGVFLVMPPALQALWPVDRGDTDDDSPPHFTLLYGGEVEEDRQVEFVEVVRSVLSNFAPFELALEQGVAWFENDEGQQIAHKGVAVGHDEMERLHDALRDALEGAGFTVKHHDSFIAHATLGYLDTQEYPSDWPVPEGAFVVDNIDVWGWTTDITLPLGESGVIEFRAARRKATRHSGRHPVSHPRFNKEGEEQGGKHPHADGAIPSGEGPRNEQVTWDAGDDYQNIAQQYGSVRPGEQTNLKHYDYAPHARQIDDMARDEGYDVYFAGGQYGKPDLTNRNYNTGHLMVYDPTPGEGGDFGDEEYTKAWRTIHELAHAQVYEQLNDMYGEGRRIGKLGWQRTPREAKRAVHWEWLAAHRQRELGERLGYSVDDETFNKELNCLDAETEALTRRGWVRGFDLEVTDVLLTKNPETGSLEWQEMTDLRLFPDFEGDVVVMQSKSFEAVTTPNHRWLVTTNQGRVRERLSKDMVLNGDRIHRTGEYVAPEESRLSPDEAELLGWFVTDGHYQKKADRREGPGHKYAVSGVYAKLSQQRGSNDVKVARIHALLARLSDEVSYQDKPSGQTVWTLGPRLTALLLVEAPDRHLTQASLQGLDSVALDHLCEAMLLGDGSTNTSGQQSLVTGREEQADAFQTLLTLRGVASSKHWRDMSKYAPKSAKLSNIPKMTGVWVVNLLKRQHVRLMQGHVRQETRKVGMWCPVVPNTFFVARRSGQVWVTGNTVMHDAVHRAITGQFTNPDQEGFEPSTQKIPLEVALGQIDAAAKKLGLADDNAVLSREQKQQLKQQRQGSPFGHELGDLTEEQETHQLDEPSRMNDSYSSENQFEDPNLKLGQREVSGVEIVRDVPDEWPVGEIDEAHFYAEVDGARVGFLGAYLQRDPEGRPKMRVFSTNVAEDLRGRGIGQMLYRDALDFASEHNAWMRSDTAVSEDARRVWQRVNRDPQMSRQHIERSSGDPLVNEDPRSFDAEEDWQWLWDRNVAPELHYEYRTAAAGHQPTACIDLDGTLLEPVDHSAPSEDSGQPALSAPMEGAAGAMSSLHELGWRVVVYTARLSFADSPEQLAHMVEEIEYHLQRHNIHFDEVATGPKPVADVYIDDRGEHFDGDWWAMVKKVTSHDRQGAGLGLNLAGDENDWTDATEMRDDLSVDPEGGRDQTKVGRDDASAPGGDRSVLSRD